MTTTANVPAGTMDATGAADIANGIVRRLNGRAPVAVTHGLQGPDTDEGHSVTVRFLDGQEWDLIREHGTYSLHAYDWDHAHPYRLVSLQGFDHDDTAAVADAVTDTITRAHTPGALPWFTMGRGLDLALDSDYLVADSASTLDGTRVAYVGDVPDRPGMVRAEPLDFAGDFAPTVLMPRAALIDA